MNLLVVAAWEPELEHFRALHRADPARASGGRDLPPPTLNIDAVGIGAVDAAAGMTRCIALHQPGHVLLLGTCGAVPGSGLSIGDVIVGTDVLLVDPATVEGRAALPFGPPAVALDPGPGPAAAFVAAGARPAKIYCTLGITTDDALAVTLAASGDVEHLEAYSVARACDLAGVRCTIALAVANEVGSRGRAEWRTHHVAASMQAADVAYRALRTSTTARSPA